MLIMMAGKWEWGLGRVTKECKDKALLKVILADLFIAHHIYGALSLFFFFVY